MRAFERRLLTIASALGLLGPASARPADVKAANDQPAQEQAQAQPEKKKEEKPKEPPAVVTAGKAGRGALEVAARYGVLDVDRDVFKSGYADAAKSARKAKAWGIGVNWYLTRNVKYVANYDHTTFEGGAAAGANRKAENAFLLRAQVSF